MVVWTERGDICPRVRRWLVAVMGPVGIGALEGGVRSRGSPGCGLEMAGCTGGNSSRGVSMRVGEVGPLYADEVRDSAESLWE